MRNPHLTEMFFAVALGGTLWLALPFIPWYMVRSIKVLDCFHALPSFSTYYALGGEFQSAASDAESITWLI